MLAGSLTDGAGRHRACHVYDQRLTKDARVTPGLLSFTEANEEASRLNAVQEVLSS